MTGTFDLNSPDTIADPYPSYAWLREHAPVYHSVDPDLWIVSRYDDVRAVVRDSRRFSSAVAAIGSDPFNPTASPWLSAVLSRLPAARVLLTSDPPDHTMLRRKVSRAFVPRRIMEWEPRIREVAADLVEQMSTDPNPDLVRDLAAPLPAIIIAEMLGVPAQRRHDFKRWSDALIDGLLTGGSRTAMMRGAAAISWFFYRTIRQRRRAPDDDLISTLIAGEGEDALSTAEIVNFCILLLVAGHETTTNLISNAALALFERPDLRARVHAEPELAAAVVTETLRFDGPAQALLRVADTDIDLGESTVPAGSYILPLLGAANRDPRRFADPDEFRLDRAEAGEHLAFGAGIHFCLGSALARMEATAAIEELMRRAPALTPSGAPERIASPVLRGLRSQPVRLGATTEPNHL
ncbi:cytochrome P450 [Nocardia sp. NPDC127579]|uniref:cytochrome P450 n=1 Tax=Nocardia sp. NPDC127579 TaxID=3345402 RepID=UPI003635EFC7